MLIFNWIGVPLYRTVHFDDSCFAESFSWAALLFRRVRIWEVMFCWVTSVLAFSRSTSLIFFFLSSVEARTSVNAISRSSNWLPSELMSPWSLRISASSADRLWVSASSSRSLAEIGHSWTASVRLFSAASNSLSSLAALSWRWARTSSAFLTSTLRRVKYKIGSEFHRTQSFFQFSDPLWPLRNAFR